MKKSVAIIGNFELLVECVKMLQQSDFTIKCIFSESLSVKEWAHTHDIPLANSVTDFYQTLTILNVDYLFSVQNPYIIPADVLKSVGKLAINYHNSLLPDYAGNANNVAWMIWNNERVSGITWHVINEVIDSGRILKQIKFKISHTETSASLLLKCQEYAILTFNNLLTDLLDNSTQLYDQDLNKRRYFYSYDRPCGFAVINWNNKAENIYRHFRALSFGFDQDVITCLKFKYAGNYYAIKDMQVLSNKINDFAPGYIVNANNNELQVATKSYDILLTYQMLEISDKPALIASHSKLQCERVDLNYQRKIAKQIAKDEVHWHQELANFEAGKNFIQDRRQTYIDFNLLSQIKFNEIMTKNDSFDIDYIYSLIFAYLFRVNDYEGYSLPLAGNFIEIPPKVSPNLFLPIKPLQINFNNRLNFTDILGHVKQLVFDLKQKLPCFKDNLVRYPQFAEALSLNSLLIFSGTAKECKKAAATSYPLIINVDENSQTINLFVATNYMAKMPIFLNFFAEHLINLATNWLNSTKKLYEVDILSKAEVCNLTVWNDTHANYPLEKSLPEILDEICLKYPDNIALESSERKVSYKELKSHTDQMANNILYNLGNQHNKHKYVGVFLNKSIDTILTFIAVLKSGFAYLVLDPSYPDSYLEHILDISQTQVFIGQTDNQQRLSKLIHHLENYPPVIFLELAKLIGVKNNSKTILAANNLSAENLAYILFTSGSTGKPKGVMIKHSSVINLAYGVISYLKLTPQDKILQFSTLAFDASVWEIYSSLLIGGNLYIPSSNEVLLDNSFKKTLLNKKISTLVLPTQSLNTLPYFENLYLKNIIVAGEKCTAYIAKVWGYYYNLINAYGPTECTVCSTMGTLKSTSSITIGKPIENYQIIICDKYHQPMVMGAIGNIAIAGAGLAVGYLNNDKLTHERFKLLNFLGKDARFYLSGDLGHWTANGEINYISRNDEQIKIRGFRIEPKLIEQVLMNYDGVKIAIVRAAKLKDDKVLNAYLLMANKREKPDLEKIQSFLKQRLPQFMLPSRVFVIKWLLLTKSGKIDYKRLIQAKNLELLVNKIKYVSNTILQKEIELIWQDIFNIKYPIDINTDFFTYGGTSLQLTKMILAIQQKYQVDISIADFLTSPTITKLESLVLQDDSSSFDVKKEIQSSLSKLDNIINSKQEFINSCSTKVSVAKINRVLLTGVTGFLGSYLAKYFLLEGLEVFCLIKAEESSVFNKVHQVLKSYHWADSDIHKLKLIPGDLSLPKLGLENIIYNQLAEDIDVICNSGAFVNHILNYRALMPANVDGVWHCIEFAMTGKPKGITQISTMSIEDGIKPVYFGENFIKLTDLQANINSLSGYNATKLAAELGLSEVMAKTGLPIKIYRPGWISGDSHTGIFAYQKNHLFRLIKGCLQLGFAPDWDRQIGLFPVDYLAKFIVKDMLNDKQWNNVYNLNAAQIIDFKQLLTYFAQHFKVKLKFIAPNRWQALLRRVNANNALFALLTSYSGKLDNTSNGHGLVTNSANFFATYYNLGLPQIKTILDLLPIYTNFLLQQGALYENRM